MKGRLRAVAVFLVILALGALVGSALSQWSDRGVGTLGGGKRSRATGRVRVEVLNGGGQAGAAREATDQLRDLGFDVVFFGNAGTFEEDSSRVLDRMGRLEVARDVADALGIRNVRSEPDANLYLDVTVVLGRDWVPAPPVEMEGGAPAARPWWDPRRWLRR